MSLRLKFLLAVIVFVSGALFWTVSPKQRRKGPFRFETYTTTGVRLASFYRDLPTASRFSGGRNFFTSIPPQSCKRSSFTGKFASWLEALIGNSTVRAQSPTCNTKTQSFPCGYTCSSDSFDNQVSGSCSQATDAGGQVCDPACNLIDYSDDSCSCGGGGGGDDCSNDPCECEFCGVY